MQMLQVLLTFVLGRQASHWVWAGGCPRQWRDGCGGLCGHESTRLVLGPLSSACCVILLRFICFLWLHETLAAQCLCSLLQSRRVLGCQLVTLSIAGYVSGAISVQQTL